MTCLAATRRVSSQLCRVSMLYHRECPSTPAPMALAGEAGAGAAAAVIWLITLVGATVQAAVTVVGEVGAGAPLRTRRTDQHSKWLRGQRWQVLRPQLRRHHRHHHQEVQDAAGAVELAQRMRAQAAVAAAASWVAMVVAQGARTPRPRLQLQAHPRLVLTTSLQFLLHRQLATRRLRAVLRQRQAPRRKDQHLARAVARVAEVGEAAAGAGAVEAATAAAAALRMAQTGQTPQLRPLLRLRARPSLLPAGPLAATVVDAAAAAVAAVVKGGAVAVAVAQQARVLARHVSVAGRHPRTRAAAVRRAVPQEPPLLATAQLLRRQPPPAHPQAVLQLPAQPHQKRRKQHALMIATHSRVWHGSMQTG